MSDYDDMDEDNFFYDPRKEEEEENDMTIDFNKPTYIVWDTSHEHGVYGDLDKAIAAASRAANDDRQGDDRIVMRSMKRISRITPPVAENVKVADIA